MKVLHNTFITVLMMLCVTAGTDVKAQSLLRRQGTATQLTVDGKPTLLLGGELSNSAVSSVADVGVVIPQVAQWGLQGVGGAVQVAQQTALHTRMPLE